MRLALAMLVVVTCLSGAMCAPVSADPALSAPSLGDQTYSIHFAGTLQDAFRELQKLTGMNFGFAGPRNAPPGGAAPGAPGAGGARREDTPVNLDFTDATLDKILLSLCEQAKLVYDTVGRGRYVQLRDGDVNVDSRPTTVVGEYLLRINEVAISSSSRVRLSWGAPPPDPTENYALSFDLGIIPRSPEARLKLAGLDLTMKGTTETGLTLENEPRRGRGGPPLIQGNWQTPAYYQCNPSIAAPPEGPTKLVKLEGALRLYPEVKSTEISIAPDSVDKALEQDGCSVTVEAWQVAGDMVTVRLREKHDLLPRTPEMQQSPNNDAHTGVLVGKDGKDLPSGESYSTNSFAGNDGVYRVSLSFRPQGEVDHLRLTVIRRGMPSEVVPFVLEDVPLP